jgi:hypothetical protein
MNGGLYVMILYGFLSSTFGFIETIMEKSWDIHGFTLGNPSGLAMKILNGGFSSKTYLIPV